MEELEPQRRESDRARGKLRKGMYILPSLFTSANIAAGFYAILQTVYGGSGEVWHLDFAAKAIGFAVLFDGLDGRGDFNACGIEHPEQMWKLLAGAQSARVIEHLNALTVLVQHVFGTLSQ